MKGIICLVAILAGSGTLAASAPTRFTADGKMNFPEGYREWVFLSAGIDMSYRNGPGADAHSMFSNIFVNPEAYHEFIRTGHWPENTVLVMEMRTATQKGSINRKGKFQTDLMGVEVHVKDSAHLPGGWGFFAFDAQEPATLIPHAASCYECHQQHGAVDTTFVQFYPTLLEVARK